LLSFRRFSRGFRGTLFFSNSRVGGNSGGLLELLDSTVCSRSFGFGGDPSRFGLGSGGFGGSAVRFHGGATLLGFRDLGRRFRGALFFNHSRVSGNSSGLLELFGSSMCSRRLGFGGGTSRFRRINSDVRGGAALLRVRGFGSGFRRALFCVRGFGLGFCRALFCVYSGGFGDSDGLIDRTICVHGLGFGGSQSRFGRGDGGFRRSATLLRLRGFGSGVRGTLFLLHARLVGGSRGLLGCLRLRNRLCSSPFLGNAPL
jgi:hypothetical protein